MLTFSYYLFLNNNKKLNDTYKCILLKCNICNVMGFAGSTCNSLKNNKYSVH